MNARKIMPILIIGLIILLGFGTSVWAVPGDCDGDTFLGMSDLIYLIEYLWNNGPLPSMPDCDCDGFPGLNFGDQLHLSDVINSGATPYGYPGLDFLVLSNVELYYNEPVPGDLVSFTLNIYIDVPPEFDIHTYIIPFSFAPQSGTAQAPLTCNSIDFTGSVANILGGAEIDNTNDIFILQSVGIITPAISGGASGLLCSVNFTSGAGTPNPITMTTTKTLQPMLFARNDYQGTDGVRIFLPAVIRAPYGDANCDGIANVSDAVWIVNYVFLGGPAPGDC
jgi:hypothetical protein